MSMQDWDPLVFKKNTATGVDRKEAERKTSLMPSHVQRDKKLDAATEADKVVMMPRDVVVQLIAGRVAKKLSQKQLATQLNIPVKTIQDIETHKYKKDMGLAQRIAKSVGIRITK